MKYLIYTLFILASCQQKKKEISIVDIAADDYRHYHPQYPSILKQYPSLAPQIVATDANKWAQKVRAVVVDKKQSFLIVF